MITLNYLLIKTKFKNLNNLKIDFTNTDGLTVLIGNNGCGKSNIIEALSSIFAGLYDTKFKPDFSYELSYKKDTNDIVINYNHTSKTYVPHNSYTKEDLPNQVIALYSGEESRLWERYYFDFYEAYNQNVMKSQVAVSEDMTMLFVNKYHWNTALLTMIKSDFDLHDVLNGKTVEKIVFHFDKYAHDNILKFDRENPNDVTKFCYSILNTTQGKTTHGKTTTVEFNVDDFKYKFPQSHTEFFKLISVATLPKDLSWKLITQFELIFTDGFSSRELSEGEKKLLLIKFITKILADDNSLFLLDEPDSHIHIGKKEQIKHHLYDSNTKVHVESILTTHSPTLSHHFDQKNIIMLTNDNNVCKQVSVDKQQALSHLTNGIWTYQQQNIFLSSDKPIILLVEGRHDKTHLTNAFNKLQDEFEGLDFDIFSLGGESKIRPFMTGLAEIEDFNQKLFIAIYDNDGAGINSFEKGWKKRDDSDYKVLKNDVKEKDNCLGFLLVKPEKYSSDCTIESMYDYGKYQNIYQNTVSSHSYFANKSIEDISKEIKEKAKNTLAEQSTNFDKEDFKYFRPLFELIQKIKNDNLPQENLSNTPVTNTEEIKSNDDDSNTLENNSDSNSSDNNDSIIEVFYKNENLGIDAQGLYNLETKKLTVKAGSLIRKDNLPSACLRARINFSSIKPKERENYLEMIEAVNFSSSTSAINFVGQSISGVRSWIDKDGKNINQF